MQIIWIAALILVMLLYVHRSSQAKISMLFTQLETLKTNIASNTMTPEDIDQAFDRKVREMEMRRIEAMKAMREAHVKQMDAGPSPATAPQQPANGGVPSAPPPVPHVPAASAAPAVPAAPDAPTASTASTAPSVAPIIKVEGNTPHALEPTVVQTVPTIILQKPTSNVVEIIDDPPSADDTPGTLGTPDAPDAQENNPKRRSRKRV